MKDLPDSNLKLYNDLNELVKKIGYGELESTFDLHNGYIVAVRFYGSKRVLYNRSAKDQNTNKTALLDIARRISQALEVDDLTELHFSVHINNKKIRSVSWKSEVKKKYPIRKRLKGDQNGKKD